MPVKVKPCRAGKANIDGILRRCGGNVAKAFIKIDEVRYLQSLCS